VDKAARVPQQTIIVTTYFVKETWQWKYTKPQTANFIELRYLNLRPTNLIVLSRTRILYYGTQNSFNQRSRDSTELCILQPLVLTTQQQLADSDTAFKIPGQNACNNSLCNPYIKEL
jgi:hypothetical protein